MDIAIKQSAPQLEAGSCKGCKSLLVLAGVVNKCGIGRRVVKRCSKYSAAKK